MGLPAFFHLLGYLGLTCLCRALFGRDPIRLAMVDRNILRLAMYELLFQCDTPHAVVIDEAIEIAKKYGAEESPRFVNGVLDGFLKRRVGAG